MAKLLKGLVEATYRFIVVGVIIPFAIDYFYSDISKLVTLPPSSERWLALGIFGILFAITGFLQNAYVNGEFPWLAGKIGGGLVGFAFYSYVFLFLPSIAESSQNFRASGLLSLFYLSIGLSYLYLILDFADTRKSRAKSNTLNGTK